MTITLHLPAEVEEKLKEDAAETGVTIEDYAMSLLGAAVPPTPAIEARMAKLNPLFEFLESLPDDPSVPPIDPKFVTSDFIYEQNDLDEASVSFMMVERGKGS